MKSDLGTKMWKFSNYILSFHQQKESIWFSPPTKPEDKSIISKHFPFFKE